MSSNNNNTSLFNKVALITGASSGIGAATARIFANAGAKLVLHGRDSAKLKNVIDSIKRSVPDSEVVGLSGDIALESVNKNLVDLALTTYGALHIAFNNAGTFQPAGLQDVTEELVDSLYNTNVKGVIFGIKHQLPAIARSSCNTNWGVIINNSSILSTRVREGINRSIYASTKASVDLLTQHAAVEGASLFVRVNSVNPGFTASEGLVGEIGGENTLNKVVEQVSYISPAASTNEIGEFVRFIASNETGRYFNGSNLVIDGGFGTR